MIRKVPQGHQGKDGARGVLHARDAVLTGHHRGHGPPKRLPRKLWGHTAKRLVGLTTAAVAGPANVMGRKPLHPPFAKPGRDGVTRGTRVRERWQKCLAVVRTKRAQRRNRAGDLASTSKSPAVKYSTLVNDLGSSWMYGCP
jgi:hypothetical protein